MKAQGGIRAFTLIELVVVAAIIGVLIALAVPVIGAVRAKGSESHCLANARQLGHAMTQYAAENNSINGMGQVLEPGGLISNWMVRMRPYFGANAYADVRTRFICRSHPKFVLDNEAHVGWAFNTQFAPVNLQLPRAQKISDPARTIYAAEGYRDFDWHAGDGHKANFKLPEQFARKNVMNSGERVFFPHGGQSATVFLDGHVELLAAPISLELWALEK